MKIGIIGLGLIGGSLGLTLKNVKFISSIVGLDKNIENEKEALKLGLIDEIVNLDTIKTCDIIFIAIPVESIITALEDLKDVGSETTIIDLGSTKAKIIKNTPPCIRKNFVAAHPMSGTEKFGPSAAFDGLFKDAVVVLCDIENSGELHKNRAIEIFSHIGMKIVFMKPDSHDNHVAVISHLPHALSYSLANSVIKLEKPRNILLLAGGGFRSMSRIAKSSPAMWTDVFKQNKNNVLESIERFEKELILCKKMIEEDRWQELYDWMEEATSLHKIL